VPLRTVRAGVAFAQFGFQQVHGLGEGLPLAGGELVKDAGERVRRAVEPFVDQAGLGVGDGGDGASPVGGVRAALDEPRAVQVGEHSADGGQGEAEPGGELADGERPAAKLLERGRVPGAERGGCRRRGAVLPAAHPAGDPREDLHQAQAQRGVLRDARVVRHDPPLTMLRASLYGSGIKIVLPSEPNPNQEVTLTTPGQPAALEALFAEGKLAGSWTLDAARSQVRLATKSMWNLVPVKGVFGEVSGSATVTESGEVTGTLTVAAGSIDTKIKKRDDHLRSADFFDAANHPDITFSIEAVTPAADGVTVTGSLTVRGTTRPVSFGAAVAGGDGEVTLDAEVPVNRTDYGITFNQLGMMGTHNTITIHAVFTRQ
jgi:polyisoprenoid-binding protein YceI